MSSITSECLFGADATKRAGARAWGEMLMKGVNGPRQLTKSALAGHLQAAVGGNARDIARVASVRDPSGYFGKAAEILEEAARLERLPQSPFRSVLEKSLERRSDELAAHEDRPTREHALLAAQHRQLAEAHEARQYVEQSAGNLTGAQAHQAAADSHYRAAALASTHDSEAPFASHRAREATRRANRCCSEQVHLPGHASKAAGGDGFSRPAGATRGSDTNFGSRAVREQRFEEPRSNPYAFHTSGRVSGGAREAGDSYAPDQPVHPLDFLLNPVNDPRSLNWSRGDFGSPGQERSAGIDYNPSRPAKAAGAGAGYDPNEPLVAMSKRMMSGAPLAKSLDLAHALTVAGKLPETAYRAILRLRDFKARATKATYRNIQADEDYRSTVRAIQAAAIEQADRETLLASIA